MSAMKKDNPFTSTRRKRVKKENKENKDKMEIELFTSPSSSILLNNIPVTGEQKRKTTEHSFKPPVVNNGVCDIIISFHIDGIKPTFKQIQRLSGLPSDSIQDTLRSKFIVASFVDGVEVYSPSIHLLNKTIKEVFKPFEMEA